MSGEAGEHDKHVLLITWAYPPLNHTASARSGCLAKYLVRCGWTPIVVSPRWTEDNSPHFDPAYVSNMPNEIIEATVPLAVEPYPGLVSRCVEQVEHFLLPHRRGEYFHWAREAKATIDSLMARYDVRATWATFPDRKAESLSHALADWTRRRYGTPWIADFRDTFGQFEVKPFFQQLRLPFKEFHERRFSSSASAFTAVSNGLAAELQKKTGRRVKVIENGYDPEDYRAIPEREGETFVISYSGTLLPMLGQHDIRSLLDPLGDLVETGEIDRNKVRVELYGMNGPRAQTIPVEHPLSDRIVWKGRVSKREVIELMGRSQVLLLLGFRRSHGVLTSKVFEYLAADRPILAVAGEEDEVSGLIRRTDSGVSCSNREMVRSVLSRWYREWSETGAIFTERRHEEIGRYRRSEQAGRVAGLLAEIS